MSESVYVLIIKEYSFLSKVRRSVFAVDVYAIPVLTESYRGQE